MRLHRSIGKQFTRSIVSGLLLLGLAWSTGHAAPPAPLSTDGVAPLVAYTYPLAKFMVTNEPLYLRNSTSSYTLSVPLAKRMRVKSALLHLEFTNSTALLEHRSQLRVSLNDQVIAQVPLRPHQPEAVLEVRLPVRLLQADYNRLQFQVAQHYTEDCEDPAAPELWTQIDPVASTLSLEATFLPLVPTLSELGDFFDRKWWETPQLHIMTGTAAPRDVHLQWGSLVAQGAALRLEYVPLHVTHGVASPKVPDTTPHGPQTFPQLDQESLKGKDIALVGTKAELSPYLSPEMLAQIHNGYLAVHPLDSDPSHLLLVVSGRDEAEVTRAATALAFLNFPFPDTATAQITEMQLPLLPDYTAKRSVHEEGNYPFTHFEFQTTTVKGSSVEPLRIEAVFPPDLFTHENSVVELHLHLAYGASLRADSVLNVLLNDRFENAIALSQTTGAAYRDYKLPIPLRSFQPGRNILTFTPQMMPSVTGKCVPLQQENLLLTLFADSTLSLPPASHYVRLPDLHLFAKAAFPYTVRPDGSALALHVADSDSQTIASAWMVMGKLAQRIGVPLHQAELSFQLPTSEKNLILLGAVDKLDPRLLAAAPMPLGQGHRVPYPTLAAESPPAPSLFSWEWLSTRVSWLASANGPPAIPPASAHFLQVSEFGRNTVAMMLESPLHAQKTALLITAADATHLSQGVRHLITPEIWDNLQGDVAVWRDDPKSLTWQRAGPDYHVGTVSLTTQLEYRFSQNPWMWAATVLALLGAFAWLTRVLLLRFKRKHHGDLSAEESAE